jgi:hypothetical protein
MRESHQAEKLRAHLLGYFRPRGSPVIVDSARHAGYLGESVLLHEETHQQLTLQTSHGLMTYIVDMLRSLEDRLTRAMQFNLEQELDLLLATSIACHEGFATWHQIFYLGSEFSRDVAVEAYSHLPDDYQRYHAEFERIAMYFDGHFRSGWGSISVLIGSFARAAMMTRILGQFAAKPPDYSELREFLRRPENNPDERLSHIVRTLLEADDELRNDVIAVFKMHVSFIGIKDGFRRWRAEPPFFSALHSVVFAWVATRACLMSSRVFLIGAVSMPIASCARTQPPSDLRLESPTHSSYLRTRTSLSLTRQSVISP